MAIESNLTAPFSDTLAELRKNPEFIEAEKAIDAEESLTGGRALFSIERMDKALAEPRATLPRGLTREEKRAMLNIMVGDINADQGKTITGDTIEEKAESINDIILAQKKARY